MAGSSVRGLINQIGRSFNLSKAKPAKVPKKTLAAIVGVAAASLLYQITPGFEGGVEPDGTSIGYRDVVGVPTKCYGDTTDVVVGKRYTRQECKDSLERQLIAHAEPVMACTPQLQVCTVAGSKCYTQIAAFVDFAYNVGVGNYCSSSVAIAFRAGDIDTACKRLNEKPNGKPQWIFAKGKPFPGLIRRRGVERSLCEQALS